MPPKASNEKYQNLRPKIPNRKLGFSDPVRQTPEATRFNNYVYLMHELITILEQ